MRNQIRNIAWTTLLAALFLFPQNMEGQYALDYGFAFGTGNYLGDIGGDALERRDFFPDLHLSQTKLSSHFFVRQRLNGAFALRAQLGTTYIEDYDNLSTNPARKGRNAHFRNFINELSLRGEVTFFSNPQISGYKKRNRVGLSAYSTFGVAGFIHNPQARLDPDAAAYHYAQGNISSNPSLLNYETWYDLRDVGTEKEKYGLGSMSFPLGVGASFMVNYNIRIGLEVVWNITLTDYLDDVSNTYANPTELDDIGLILSSPSSPNSLSPDQNISPSYNSPEHYVEGNYNWSPNAEVPRGNPDKNDSYGTLQLTVSKVVKNSSAFFKSNNYSARRAAKRRAYRGKPDNSNRVFGRPKV